MSRRVGLIISVISAALLAVSVVSMTRRVKEFNLRADFPDFHYKNVTTRELEAWGRPVHITDAALDHAPHGVAAIKIDYAGQSLVTPIAAPPAPDLPKLSGYAEWLCVLDIKEYPPHTVVEATTPPVGQRVVIVKRNSPQGYDPSTWGSVRRADWTFDFYTLTPQGTIEHELWRFPRTERGERGLVSRANAAVAAGKPDDPDAVLAAIKPLEERSWQYGAALYVIPALDVPQYKFKDDAVNAMGWTLPVGMFSALALTVGIVFAAARGRREPVGTSAA
jgi:hypothetical protein